MITSNSSKTLSEAKCAQQAGIFETFNDPELLKMTEAVNKWIGDAFVGQPHYWLTLSGKSDLGKTHIAKQAWDCLRRLGMTTALNSTYAPRFVYWPKFVAELRSVDETKLIALDMCRWPILVLDDIGSERDSTGFATEQLMMILGSREGRHTLLTTNLTIDQIAKIDVRLESRMVRGRNRFMQVNTITYYERTH